MGGEWLPTRLGDEVDLLTGYPFESHRYTDDSGEPRLLRGDNVGQGRLRWDGAKRWPKSDATGLEAFWLREGDVILAMDRPWIDAGLKYASVRRADLPALLVQRVARLRGGERLDTGFLRYVIGGRAFTDYVLSVQTGTAVPHISGDQIKNFAFRLPPPGMQRVIAHILGALDDKIDRNRRMSETLEAMARALFKSWSVVDATPRKAAELVSDGILEIGDGYRAKNSELGAPGLPFVRAGDLDSGFHLAGADVLSEESVAKAGSKIGRPGDVAFTSKGTIGRFARVNSRTPRFVYSPQVCYWRSLDRQRLHPAILYCWMVGDGFRAQIDAVAGQTDMAPYVSLRDQRQMEVPVFAADQTGIGDQIEPFLERQSSLAHESETLAALRDTLLPKLISGELRIPDAERIVGEVA